MKLLMLLTVLLSVFVRPEPIAAQDHVKIQKYWIMHQGREIEVEGTMQPDGKVFWNPKAPGNARPRERRDKPADEPRPSATITPAAPASWQVNGVSRDTSRPESYTAPTPGAARFVVEATEGKGEPKIHVTVIGNDDERARVVNDIKTDPAFASIKDKLLVQDYRPGEWPVDPTLGFIAGRPAIIVQTSKGTHDPKGGRVIWRQMDYSGGAASLAESIRKADPSYRPDLDPTPANPAGPKLDISQQDIAAICVGLVIFAALAYMPKKVG